MASSRGALGSGGMQPGEYCLMMLFVSATKQQCWQPMAARELLNAKATTGNRKRLVNGIVDSNHNSEDGPDAPQAFDFSLTKLSFGFSGTFGSA
jgi:hypothetical protein